MIPPGGCSLRVLRACVVRPSFIVQTSRTFSEARSFHQDAPAATSSPTINPRWLSDAKARIGKCIFFGMSSELCYEAGKILHELGSNWRELVVGSEGFLVDKRRAGLTSQAIVWGQEDSMGHVNNVQYVRFAESGRCNWTRQIGIYFDQPNQKLWSEMLTNKSYGLILKSITVDYKFPMTWPDRISVFHKLRSMPDESTETILLDVLILSEAKQRAAAKCLEDVAVYDYKKMKKSTLPPFMLKQFQIQFELQEQSKKENTARIQAIFEKVRWLEQQTWDRPDASEDLGSAKQP